VIRRRALRRTPFKRAALARNKFSAKRTEYAGRTYDSKMEANYAAKLDLLRMASGRMAGVLSWRPQVHVKLEVNGHLVATYIVDFEVTFADGHVEYHEVKGYETETWKLKEKLFRALFPERRLVVIR